MLVRRAIGWGNLWGSDWRVFCRRIHVPSPQQCFKSGLVPPGSTSQTAAFCLVRYSNAHTHNYSIGRTKYPQGPISEEARLGGNPIVLLLTGASATTMPERGVYDASS